MYKLGFLTLVLSVVSGEVVVCEDNGLDNCVPVFPVSTKTVVCDDNGVDGKCTSTFISTSISTSTVTLTSSSSFGEKNNVMYIFGLLSLLFM
jgi:hypothetical protein